MIRYVHFKKNSLNIRTLFPILAKIQRDEQRFCKIQIDHSSAYTGDEF